MPRNIAAVNRRDTRRNFSNVIALSLRCKRVEGVVNGRFDRLSPLVVTIPTTFEPLPFPSPLGETGSWTDIDNYV